METITKPESATQSAIPRQMSAAVYRGQNDVRLETIPVPQIGAGEVLVSEVTHALAMAAGYTFEPRGEHLLKGLEGPRTLFALA